MSQAREASAPAASSADPLALALGALSALCALGYLALASAGVAPGPRLVPKVVPALCLAAWVGLRGRAGRYARLVAAGLVACGVGDVLLELRFLGADRRAFLAGVAAFGLGHVAFTAASLSVERRARLARAVPFAGWAVALFFGLLPGLGGMAAPLGVYALLLATMMWRAVARLERGSGAQRAAWLGVAGALSFGASDTLLALTLFGPLGEGTRIPVMLTYWGGLVGIAASAVATAGDEEAAAAGRA